ncbi:MAG: PAC2 family protein [archaeon]
MVYKIEQLIKVKLNKPILIEGLPGIGNVGKIAIDFMIENLKAKKIMEITSNQFPHSVFVCENHLIELPTISIYYKKIKGQDYLLLAGDIQPVDEEGCYDFCDVLLDWFEIHKGQAIVTTGGIGLHHIPKKPKVYVTGNNAKFVKTFKDCEKKIYGVVGPIIGVTGLLLGLAEKRKIPAVAVLTQTFGHPSYIGIKEARETLKTLNNRFDLNLKIKQLDEEITAIEKELTEKAKLLKEVAESTHKGSSDLTYFG